MTGGAGFIGSHLVEHFHADADVVVLDNFRSGHKRNLNGLRHRLIEASILDRSAVAEAMRGVDYVFHLAAMISVPESMAKPVECVELNATGTLIVLEEAAKAGVKKLCFSSSAAVYGDNPASPKREDMLPEPKSPYAVTKLDGEYYCTMFAREGRLETACLRYFNVFGPRQDPASAYAAAVPIFLHKALKDETIQIYGDGEQTRDFIYVKDIVAANAFLATRPGLTGVYNAAYGGRISINELAGSIVALCGSASEIRHLDPRPGDIKHSRASVEKLSAAGFKPSSDLQRGLAAAVGSYRAAAGQPA